MSFEARKGGQSNKHPSMGYLDIRSSRVLRKKATVVFNLVFGTHYEVGFGKYLAFRMLGARLEVKLGGCHMDSNGTALDQFLERFSITEVQDREVETKTQSEDNQSKTSASAKASQTSDFGAGVELNTNRMISGLRTNERTAKFTKSEPNVSRSGGGREITFEFRAPHDATLSGVVTPENWFDIELLGFGSGRVCAELKAAPDDIDIRGMGGIWPKELPPRKRRLLRFLALKQLDFLPHLSKCELQYIKEAITNEESVGRKSIAETSLRSDQENIDG